MQCDPGQHGRVRDRDGEVIEARGGPGRGTGHLAGGRSSAAPGAVRSTRRDTGADRSSNRRDRGGSPAERGEPTTGIYRGSRSSNRNGHRRDDTGCEQLRLGEELRWLARPDAEAALSAKQLRPAPVSQGWDGQHPTRMVSDGEPIQPSLVVARFRGRCATFSTGGISRCSFSI